MSRRRASFDQAGFTLVELVVVLLIISILVAAGSPRFARALDAQRVKGAAERLRTDLTYARRCAIAQSRTVELRLDAAAESYRIIGVTHIDRPSSEYVVELNDYPYASEIFSTSYSGGSIRFDRFGNAAGGGSALLQCGIAQRTVLVDASTGKATLQ